MTAARSARRRAILAARADVTVREPILAPLACGCVVDSDGGVWSPCPGIADMHAEAMRLARAGIQAATVERSAYGLERIAVTPLNRALDTIAGHVAAGERAAHGLIEQAMML